MVGVEVVGVEAASALSGLGFKVRRVNEELLGKASALPASCPIGGRLLG